MVAVARCQRRGAVTAAYASLAPHQWQWPRSAQCDLYRRAAGRGRAVAQCAIL